MPNFPDDLRYSQDHVWVRVNAGTTTIGITDYAQRELGEIVIVELASVGELVEANEPFGTVEAVKAVSEMYMPFAGTIVGDQRTAERRSDGRQQRSLWRGVDGQDQAVDPEGCRRPHEQQGLRGSHRSLRRLISGPLVVDADNRQRWESATRQQHIAAVSARRDRAAVDDDGCDVLGREHAIGVVTVAHGLDLIAADGHQWRRCRTR
jgi:Glycine cleavage H-protein